MTASPPDLPSDPPSPEAALRALLLLHGPGWLGLALEVLGDLHLAEDAVAEAFAALPGEMAWSGVKNPVAWMAGAVRNCARNRRRSERAQTHLALRLRQERPAVGNTCEFASATVDPPDDSEERLSALREALPLIPERQREVIQLRLFENKTPSEVAQQMDCSETTVRTTQSRAVKSLRRLFGKSDRNERQ